MVKTKISYTNRTYTNNPNKLNFYNDKMKTDCTILSQNIIRLRRAEKHSYEKKGNWLDPFCKKVPSTRRRRR